MKKTMALIIVLSIVFALCGCGMQGSIAQDTSVKESSDGSENENGDSIAIDCPKTITKNGYNIEIVDIYTKCKNTSSTTYGWDGIFLFISCKITGEEYAHDNNDYFALYFDMYDVDNHYVGKVQAIYVSGLNNVSYGTILNDDCILDANNVTRLVFDVTD